MYSQTIDLCHLSQFSKILGKPFDIRLNKYLEKYEILEKCQYIWSRSTAMTLMDLTEKITS